MLAMRNQETHTESPTAKSNFRRLRLFDIAVGALLVLMAILAIWNILVLAGMFRSVVPDLADIAIIRDHISTRLLYFVAGLTFILFLFKEWQYGERSLGTLYVILPMLALALVPTVTDELQPNAREKTVDFTLTRCAAGSIEDGRVMDPDNCEIAAISEGEVFLADADPAGGDFELIQPAGMTSGGGRWTVTGVGNYKVYFLVRQDSMESCASSSFTNNVGPDTRLESSCIEREGAVYSVHPLITSYMGNGWLVTYQELAP